MGGQFLSLREAYISSLSLLRSLEPLEKFLGGWVVVVLKPILVISLRPKSRLINNDSSVQLQLPTETELANDYIII